MANFCDVKGLRITEVTVPNSLESGAKSVTIGIWGFKDFEGKDLHILAPPYVQVRKGKVVKDASGIEGRVQLYELSGHNPGKYSIEAQTQAGGTWDTLTVYIKDRLPERIFPASVNGKYTDNPNEVPTRTTSPTPQQVVAMLLQSWPALNQNGARTLTAQFMAETGGTNCFNWNLGNVKSGPNEPHMYLRDVWECDSAARAAAQVAAAKTLSYIATPEEAKRRRWKCPQTIVVFEPPHPQCRFRAYNSLSEGAQRWIGHHQGTARKKPGYLDALNAGDITTVAHILKSVGYYTAAEADYAAAMKTHKVAIDRALGAM